MEGGREGEEGRRKGDPEIPQKIPLVCFTTTHARGTGERFDNRKNFQEEEVNGRGRNTKKAQKHWQRGMTKRVAFKKENEVKTRSYHERRSMSTYTPPHPPRSFTHRYFCHRSIFVGAFTPYINAKGRRLTAGREFSVSFVMQFGTT